MLLTLIFVVVEYVMEVDMTLVGIEAYHQRKINELAPLREHLNQHIVSIRSEMPEENRAFFDAQIALIREKLQAG